MGDGKSRVPICVFASSLVLTITIEARETGKSDEIHLHPGGQGFWIARMIDRLGEKATLLAPLGGEAGKVIATLIASTGVELLATHREDESPVYIHDRRSGERHELAEQPEPGLSRHETDDLYSRTLEAALAAGSIVVTSRYGGTGIPVSFYARLGADLATLDVTVIGDLHGPELAAFLKEGRIDMLKVSTEDLRSDGLIRDDETASVTAAVTDLVARGALAVVVSGGEGGSSLAHIDDAWYRVAQPSLQTADHRGAGDAMTAGLAVGLRRKLETTEILKLAAAAGAANVVRHGLGSGDADLADALNETVDITEMEGHRGE
ncbi:MAG: PfkB family carbohydrate kinase [Acidimicrobiia bacterium]